MGSGGGGSSTTITVKNTTRTVSGSTLTEVGTALTNSGTREAASVQPKFEPPPNYEYDDSDRVKKVVVNVVETKEMPVWAELEAQCPPIKAEWNRFYSILDAHENKHIAIDRRHFESIHLKALGKPRDAAWKAIDDEIGAANQANEAYDTQSGHGVNEGANIKGAVQCAPEKVGAAGEAEDPHGTVQAKLVLGGPDDPLEDEADRVADRVMRDEDPHDAGANRPMPLRSGVVRRACAGTEDCSCENCSQKRQGHASVSEPLGDSADRHVHTVIGRGGQRLDDSTQAFMSQRIGHDFSRVRVHTDAHAAESAASIGALAYTVGSDVVFGQGQFAPNTDPGRRLLAHELAHVVQQGQGGPVAIQRGVVPGFLRSDTGTKAEIENAIKTEDPADIKAIDDFAAAEPHQKARLIQILLNKTNLWPFDRRAMTRIWNSFGDLSTLSDDQVALLRTCVDRGYDYKDLKREPFVAGDFRDSVKRQVLDNLNQNITVIQKEADRLGVAGDKPKEGEKYDEEILKLQDLAALIKDAKFMLARSRKIVVAHTGALESLRTGKDEGTLGGKPITFDPETEPSLPNAVPVKQADKARGEMPWGAVYPAYSTLTETIAAILAQNPALYALQILGEPMKTAGPTLPGQDPQLVYGEQSRLSGFDMLGPKEAREKVGKALLDVYNNSRITLSNVMGNKMSPLQFDMVVQQHRQGQHGPKWATPYGKFIGERVVADDKPSFDEAMEMIGLVLILGAVAIGTGGAATPLLGAILAGANVATAAAAAAHKTFEAENAQTAAQAGASAKTAVMSQRQADRATLDAQMYQFMAIAAIAGEVAGLLAPAARAGMNLGAVDMLPPVERAAAITEALESMEVGQVALRTGKSPEALAEMVAARAATDPKAKSALDKIRDFVSSLARPFGDARVTSLDNLNALDRRVASEAVERSIVTEGVDATLKKSKKTANELLDLVGEKSVVASRLKEFLALPDELTKLSPEQLGERLALLPAEAKRNPESVGKLVQVGIERLGPSAALRRAGGWDVIANAVGAETGHMQGLLAWREAALADLHTHLTKLGSAGGMKEAQVFLSRRLGVSVEELGFGAAKPMVKGTGPKDLEAILLRVSDDRALADKGLMGATSLKKMAEEGLSARDSWRTLTPQQRGEKLRELANARLREAGVPEFKSFEFSGNEDGFFLRSRWQLRLRETILANDDKFDWLLEAAYHEARHAEQTWQVARLKGTEMTVEVMEQGVARGGLGINREIAEAAKRAPIEASSAEGRQALRWYESIMGGASRLDARKTLHDAIDEAREEWERQAAFYLRSKTVTPQLAPMAREFEQKAWIDLDNLVKQYKAWPEEADAYLVQAKFQEAYQRHLSIQEAPPPTVRQGRTTP
jgi:predicted secreted Zn-dependent protease